MRPTTSSREKAPAPCATQWASCAEMATTAVTSSGGGSTITAHAACPRYEAPQSAKRPSNQDCSRSQATASAPSAISWLNGSKSPPEPNVPRQPWFTTR